MLPGTAYYGCIQKGFLNIRSENTTPTAWSTLYYYYTRPSQPVFAKRVFVVDDNDDETRDTTENWRYFEHLLALFTELFGFKDKQQDNSNFFNGKMKRELSLFLRDRYKVMHAQITVLSSQDTRKFQVICPEL